MEENIKNPEGFFDKEKLLVDKDIINPLGWEHYGQEIKTHPFDDGRSAGYIRYMIQDKAIIIIDCVITRKES